MKLHTNLTSTEVHAALTRAQLAGRVTPDVHFPVYAPERSQTHPYGYEIQLGTYNQHSLPDGTKDQYGKTMRVRRFKNSGGSGTSNVYAATWHEWGWFMAEIFQADPNARWGGNPDKSRRREYVYGYASLSDFNAKTDNQFTIPEPAPRGSQRDLDTRSGPGLWTDSERAAGTANRTSWGLRPARNPNLDPLLPAPKEGN